MADKPLLSVVENVKGQSLSKYEALIYTAKFWRPLIPLQTPVFENLHERAFIFEIDDSIQLAPAGGPVKRFNATGTIEIVDLGVDERQTHVWGVQIELKSPSARVYTRVRARDLVGHSALKVGVFIQSIEYDPTLLGGLGEDAVLFAIRLYLRKLIEKASTLAPL